jgi:hypothetical protein
MIIDSQFTITRYDGKMSLPLSSATPAGIAIGSIEESRYKRFIKSVKVIYGSQKSDGSIPIFFKNADNTISESSTLTSLEPNSSYYVVSYTIDPTNGTKIVFPYTIPTMGGSLGSTSDDASVNFTISDITYVPDDGCTSPLPIIATVSNTDNGYPYTYTISAVGASGTPSVSPESGTIICNNDRPGTIPLTLLFNDANNAILTIGLFKDDSLICSDSVSLICGEQVLASPTISTQSIGYQNQNNQDFISAQSVQSCPAPAYANTGKPDIKIVGRDKVTYLSNSDLESSIPISVILQNAKKDNYQYTYRFSISSDTGNPSISPSSGSIYANTYKCDVTGVYSSGDFVSMLSMNGAKNIVVNIDLLDKGKVLDNDYIHLIYKQTNAHTDYQTYVGCPNIDSSNSIINLSTPNSNSINIPTSISELSIGRKYNYSFESVSANWPCKIYPVSGSFNADSASVTINNMFYFDNDLSCYDCFPYSTGVAFSDDIKVKKFSILKLTVYPEDAGCEAGTNKLVNIYCNNCLLQPTPTVTPTLTPTPTITPSAVAYNTSLLITPQTTVAGESSAGLTFKGNIGDIFSFNALSPTDVPQIMRLIINNVQVSQVTFSYDDYIGKAFSFTKASLQKRYTGVFKSGDVILD